MSIFDMRQYHLHLYHCYLNLITKISSSVLIRVTGILKGVLKKLLLTYCWTKTRSYLWKEIGNHAASHKYDTPELCTRG